VEKLVDHVTILLVAIGIDCLVVDVDTDALNADLKMH
jgi:hypothetical protein